MVAKAQPTGYTGHEHLPQFGLINMNARLYDPVLGRMLSPDNFVHADAGLNGYNRYSYALNNPLKFTDPDGNDPITIGILIGVAIGAYMTAASTEGGYNPLNWSWSSSTWCSLFAGAVIGGVSGVVGAGIGAALAPAVQAGGIVVGIGADILVGAVAGAVSGAGAAGYTGGNIAQGAIGGAIGGGIMGGGIGGIMRGAKQFFASFKNNRAIPSTPDTPEPITANEVVRESVEEAATPRGYTIECDAPTPVRIEVNDMANRVKTPILRIEPSDFGDMNLSVLKNQIKIATSSTSTAPSRGYTIFKSDGSLYKFGVTDANLVRYNQSLKLAGPGSYGRYTPVIPKFKAHIHEKYLRSLFFNSTGQYNLPGMKVPYPIDFNTGKPIKY